MLEKEASLAKIGVDTAENEPMFGQIQWNSMFHFGRYQSSPYERDQPEVELLRELGRAEGRLQALRDGRGEHLGDLGKDRIEKMK